MDQKTIDKVLRCRAIIDRHRDWLREKFDKLEADVAAETAKLESKDKGDERKIAAIAEAVKIPDHDRFVDVGRMLAELKAEGFGGVDDYADWDNQQCLAAYIEYAPIAGKCDHCAGRNGNSIGICMIGTDDFTSDQWDSLAHLVNGLAQIYPIKEVLGHHDYDPNKTCPCFDVDKWWEENHIRDYSKSMIGA